MLHATNNMAVNTKTAIFWDVMACVQVESDLQTPSSGSSLNIEAARSTHWLHLYKTTNTWNYNLGDSKPTQK
jgi:hypothetical protein